jgi:hypothetical protein
MKTILMAILVGLIAIRPAGAATTPLLVYPTSNSVDEYTHELPPGVTVSSDPAKSPNGPPTLKITFEVPDGTFVPLVHVPSKWKWKGWLGVRYTAQVCSDDSPGWGNIQMRWRFVGGNDAWCGGLEPHGNRTEWSESDPFLGSPLRMDLIEIVFGVKVNGKGTLWVRDARATEESNGMAGLPGDSLMGIVGGIAGSLIGIWGGLVGYLASRGRAKEFVLRGSIATATAGLVLLVAGVALFFAKMPYAYWYPCGLLGLIMACVFGGNYKGLQRRYAAKELERLNAKDASDGI